MLNEGGTTPTSDGGATADQTGPDAIASSAADGGVLSVALGDQPIVEVNQTGARTSAGEGNSDATVLSILGYEVIGAHASASNGSGESQTGCLTETCTVTGGDVCLALLFAQAFASNDGDRSDASSDTAVVSACLGGDQSDPAGNCGGLAGAAVAESHSASTADQGDGSASADQWSNGADVCVGGEAESSGACEGAGAEVLHSESHSAANAGSEPESDSDSSTAVVEAGGDDVIAVDVGAELPQGCVDDSSLACAVLNDADSSAGTGGTIASAVAGSISVLTDDDGAVVDTAAGESQTDASRSTSAGDDDTGDEDTGADEPVDNDNNAPAGDYRPAGTVQGSGEDRVSGAPAGGGTLPFTGDSLWVVFLIGFAMVAVGAVMYVLSIAQLRSMRLTTVLREVRHIDRGVFGIFR